MELFVLLFMDFLLSRVNYGFNALVSEIIRRKLKTLKDKTEGYQSIHFNLLKLLKNGKSNFQAIYILYKHNVDEIRISCLVSKVVNIIQLCTQRKTRTPRCIVQFSHRNFFNILKNLVRKELKRFGQACDTKNSEPDLQER